MAMTTVPNCWDVNWYMEKQICDMAAGVSLFECSGGYCEGLSSSCVPSVCR